MAAAAVTQKTSADRVRLLLRVIVGAHLQHYSGYLLTQTGVVQVSPA